MSHQFWLVFVADLMACKLRLTASSVACRSFSPRLCSGLLVWYCICYWRLPVAPVRTVICVCLVVLYLLVPWPRENGARGLAARWYKLLFRFPSVSMGRVVAGSEYLARWYFAFCWGLRRRNFEAKKTGSGIPGGNLLTHTPGGFKDHLFECQSKYRLHVRNPDVKSYRLVYKLVNSERVGGGGGVRGVPRTLLLPEF